MSAESRVIDNFPSSETDPFAPPETQAVIGDLIIEVSPTGELVWILGPHENWDPIEFGPYLLSPVGSFDWQYHQHAPELMAEGNLLLFDKGMPSRPG